MRLPGRSVLCVFLLWVSGPVFAQSSPPASTIPPLLESRAEPFCIDCLPFEPKAHKAQLAKLVNNEYVAELRKALYMQDVVHQTQSKAHFDNCDFDGSVAYIQALMKDVGEQVALATAAGDKGDSKEKAARVRQAFFTLGQALHGTQDFYAHTNYLEMHVGSVSKIQQMKVVPVWTEAGAEQVKALVNKGLKSGYVFWGLPQKCSTKSPSHAELAKDSEKTASGKLAIAHLQNLSQFTAAQFLARRASLELVSYAFDRWPLLKEMNGQALAFEVLVENRDLK